MCNLIYYERDEERFISWRQVRGSTPFQINQSNSLSPSLSNLAPLLSQLLIIDPSVHNYLPKKSTFLARTKGLKLPNKSPKRYFFIEVGTLSSLWPNEISPQTSKTPKKRNWRRNFAEIISRKKHRSSRPFDWKWLSTSGAFLFQYFWLRIYWWMVKETESI